MFVILTYADSFQVVKSFPFAVDLTFVAPQFFISLLLFLSFIQPTKDHLLFSIRWCVLSWSYCWEQTLVWLLSSWNLHFSGRRSH